MYLFFVCREVRQNVPVSFNSSADTVNFLSQKAYVFDSATSCGGCNPFVDKFVTVNIPLLVGFVNQCFHYKLNSKYGSTVPVFIRLC